MKSLDKCGGGILQMENAHRPPVGAVDHLHFGSLSSDGHKLSETMQAKRYGIGSAIVQLRFAIKFGSTHHRSERSSVEYATMQTMTKEVNMDFNDLTPEQIEKAKACTTVDELVALAKDEGVELSDEQLEAISGGGNWKGCWVKDCKDFICKELE